MIRGLWPDFYESLNENNLFRIIPVRINDIENFKDTVKKFEQDQTKIAGFIHEIILMNYGAIKLKEAYLQEAYSVCRNHDIPVIADEFGNLWRSWHR